jgi:hypothetical protein
MARHNISTGGAQATLQVNASRKKRREQQLRLRIRELTTRLELLDENQVLKKRIDALKKITENEAMQRKNRLIGAKRAELLKRLRMKKWIERLKGNKQLDRTT